MPHIIELGGVLYYEIYKSKHLEDEHNKAENLIFFSLNCSLYQVFFHTGIAFMRQELVVLKIKCLMVK